ncbi:unnamed protein product [Phytophthora lilii]|uniref:Unnamed protein product n=1 Tax=Phytophthora lilii TaxID=2077276 RepID=A0A9W6U1K3_9STRA|nr:unnamed protein product [Phytophthora lilii]
MLHAQPPKYRVVSQQLSARRVAPSSIRLRVRRLGEGANIEEHPALIPRIPRGVTTLQTPSKSFQELLSDRPLPEGTLDFLLNTLQLEPKFRLSAKQCLEHPFLRPLRDAEFRDREKRYRSGRTSRLSDDEGIEEDIPGGDQSASHVHPIDYKADQKNTSVQGPVSPYKSGPHTFDFKQDGEKGTDATASAKSKQRLRRLNGRGPNAYDNNTECDSDDIQEIIETEESTNNDFKLPRDVLPRSKCATRRGPLTASAKDVDPLDGDSCYEDDFEEYHHGYE